MHGLTLVAILCLSGGLWVGANAGDECCPHGWTKSAGRCYLYVATPADFHAAENFCIEKGANLASIRNKAEMDDIREMIKRLTGKDQRVWIGGFDSLKEGVWRWTDGSDFELSQWSRTQPDNHDGAEHCVELNFNNALNDHRCSVMKPYVCAMDQ